jgi:hypothetical protein
MTNPRTAKNVPLQIYPGFSTCTLPFNCSPLQIERRFDGWRGLLKISENKPRNQRSSGMLSMADEG